MVHNGKKLNFNSKLLIATPSIKNNVAFQEMLGNRICPKDATLQLILFTQGRPVRIYQIENLFRIYTLGFKCWIDFHTFTLFLRKNGQSIGLFYQV